MSKLSLPLVGLLGLAAPAGADTVSTMSRADSFAAQVSVLDGRAAEQYSASIRLQPPRAEIPAAAIPVYAGVYRGPHLVTAQAAAVRHGIPVDLFLRLVQQESGWNTTALSQAGAMGLAQLMPDTARLLGVDAADPVQNLDGGARYLRAQFDAFGDWRLALAAYNAGPGAVLQYGGMPPYAETTHYVRVILGD